MRKVIFEQIGNTVIAVILIICTCQTIATSTFSTTYGEFNTEIHFNATWLLFIISIVLFSLARLAYAKKIGAKDGYNTKEGELSAQDEREKLIGLKAAKVTYRALVYYIAVVFTMALFISIFITSAIVLRMFCIVIIGSCLIAAFLIYMVSWIVYDHRL
ncbi:hypothetical protein [Enterococcus sp. UD-01]|jgi:hypothetical protein|uniref:hypothetical protein n=1 Tax=Enterococcus sp. UD-01 TaxID=3373911 RepID=UPI003833FF00